MASGSGPSQTFKYVYQVSDSNNDGVYDIDGQFPDTNLTITDQDDPGTGSDDLTKLGDVSNDTASVSENGAIAGTITYVAETTDHKSFIADAPGGLGLVTDTQYNVGDTVETDTNPFAIACYCTGTLIRTMRGEVSVEALSIGDLVVTACGQTRPVKWIGRQSVVSALSDPVSCYPIRIAADAIAEGVPARDLYLSPDHALLIDGVLVQAGALVNGMNVTRVTNPDVSFTYYHIETDDHAIILAEGTPAETFVSNVTRRTFDNYAEYEALFGDKAEFEAMADRDEPRAMSARQVPAKIKARLAERAAALGLVEDVAA